MNLDNTNNVIDWYAYRHRFVIRSAYPVPVSWLPVFLTRKQGQAHQAKRSSESNGKLVELDGNADR